MADKAWKVAIESQDGQRALAGSPIGTPAVWQLPGSPSLKINLPTPEAESLVFCIMLLYQIYDIECDLKYT